MLGVLNERFHVTHVDAHADLGYLDTGRLYLRSDVLTRPLKERRYPEEGENALGNGNYLAFAVANHWISSIEYVLGGRRDGYDDEPTYAWQPGDLVYDDFDDSTPFSHVFRLSPMKSRNVEPEPGVRLDWCRYQRFQASEPYDFIFLARSPPYTPESANSLYERIKESYIGAWPLA